MGELGKYLRDLRVNCDMMEMLLCVYSRRGIRLLAGKGRKKTPNPKGGLTGGLGAILGMGLPGAMPR